MQNRRGSAGDPAQSEEFVVPILEEEARVEKRRVTTGKVRIRSVVEESTVRTHVKRILMKLDLRDRVQAVIFAYESGLITPR